LREQDSRKGFHYVKIIVLECNKWQRFWRKGGGRAGWQVSAAYRSSIYVQKINGAQTALLHSSSRAQPNQTEYG
jgi:hypothetical protein